MAVPVTRQVTETYQVQVPTYKTVTTNYTVCVPVWTDKTEQCTVWVPTCETRQGTRCETHCVPVKETCMRCVDKGHWEDRPVAGLRSLRQLRPGPEVQTVRCWVPNWVNEPVEVTVNKLETVQVPCTYQVQVCKPQTETCTVKVCHYESQVRTCTHQVCEYHCETRTRTCTVTECKLEAADPRGPVHRLRTEDRDPQPAGHHLRAAPGRADRALHRLGAAHGGEEGAGPGLQAGREDRSGPGLPALLLSELLSAGPLRLRVIVLLPAARPPRASALRTPCRFPIRSRGRGCGP